MDTSISYMSSYDDIIDIMVPKVFFFLVKDLANGGTIKTTQIK